MSLEKIYESVQDKNMIEDCSILYTYVKNEKPIQVLEIGAGFSTLAIAQGLKENNTDSINPIIISVDIDKTRQDEFVKKSDELALTNIKLENQNSLYYVLNNCQRESIDFIFLDSSHTCEQTILELLFLLPVLKKGGSLFLHDSKLKTVLDAIYIVLSNIENLTFLEYNTYYGLGVLKRK